MEVSIILINLYQGYIQSGISVLGYKDQFWLIMNTVRGK